MSLWFSFQLIHRTWHLFIFLYPQDHSMVWYKLFIPNYNPCLTADTTRLMFVTKGLSSLIFELSPVLLLFQFEHSTLFCTARAKQQIHSNAPLPSWIHLLLLWYHQLLLHAHSSSNKLQLDRLGWGSIIWKKEKMCPHPYQENQRLNCAVGSKGKVCCWGGRH